MEDDKFLQEKLDLLNKLIEELKKENGTPLQSKTYWSTAMRIFVGMVLLIALGCWLWTVRVIKESDNMCILIVTCITLVAIVSILSFLTYKVVFLVNSIEQRKSDYMMSINKECEMLAINLRKSLANKILDSITFDKKKDGGAEKEKKDESKYTIPKEQYEHEERMAIINALGVDCDKKSVDTIHVKLAEIVKALKEKSVISKPYCAK